MSQGSNAGTRVPIIMHIGHTGGTTMHQVVERQYRRADLYYLYTQYDDPMARLMQMSEAERAAYRVYMGHLMYGLHRWVPGESAYFTWMRHPVERILSSYFYFMRKPNLKNYRAYTEGRVSWERHLRRRWHSIAQIARVVGGDDAVLLANTVDDVPENATEVAIGHLERDFALVGLTERYDEMLLLMRQRLGWTAPITYVRQNVGQNRPRFGDLSEADQRLVARAAEVEMPLYEYAGRRFARDLEEYQGDIERDLAEFRQANAAYSQRQARVERLREPLKARLRQIGRWVRR